MARKTLVTMEMRGDFRRVFCVGRYADMLTPYMNSVPAVIAKASAIHNPIIYAITHPKYR